jgi:Holliday junction DNA helicase RuvA
MIASLRGTLLSTGVDHAIVETGGVGYLVFAPRPVLGALPSVGEEVRFHTYLVVREDALTLFGFASLQQRALFELLLSVSGVGPKVALNLIGGVQPDELRAAVAQNDTARLARVPGIGKKMSERLVLELRGKLDIKGLPQAATATVGATAATMSVNNELIELLVSLGYSVAEASGAVAALPADAPNELEDRLRLALRQLGSV